MALLALSVKAHDAEIEALSETLEKIEVQSAAADAAAVKLRNVIKRNHKRTLGP